MSTITNLDIAKPTQVEQFVTRNRCQTNQCNDMTQELLELNLQYLHYISDSKIDYENWILSIFPRIFDSLWMSIDKQTETEIIQYLRNSFNETEPMSDQEKLRQHLIEVEIYEFFSRAMEKLIEKKWQSSQSSHVIYNDQ